MAAMSGNAVATPACPASLRSPRLSPPCSSAVGARIATQTRRSLRVSCSSNAKETQKQSEQNNTGPLSKGIRSLVAAASAAVVLASPLGLPAHADVEFLTYYGTAASASSYGGYGGNASKKDTAEYVYEVPSEWKERAISKVEKGTNGTDSEFYNPKRRKEKVYTLYLAGFRKLPPKDSVLNDIALSDVDLQDLLAAADNLDFQEKKAENGQLYYDFDIEGPQGHALISVTAAKNKLYAHFVNAPPNDWTRDEATLRRIHDSFKTVGRDPLALPY